MKDFSGKTEKFVATRRTIRPLACSFARYFSDLEVTTLSKLSC